MVTTSRSSVRLSSRGDLFVGRPDVVVEQLRGRLLAGAGQVVEQAGQLDAAVHGVLDHLGADAALADQQALVDEFLDRAAGGGSRQGQPLGQREFVLEPIPGASSPSRIAASIACASW